jgi:hypothetical protein
MIRASWALQKASQVFACRSQWHLRPTNLFRATIELSPGTCNTRNDNLQLQFASRRLQSTSAAAFESDSDQPEAFSQKLINAKLWLDESLSLKLRVGALLNATQDKINPRDFNDPFIIEIVQSCCKQQTLQGLTWAQEIVEHLCLVKKQHDVTSTLPVHIKYWAHIIYGYSQLPLPVAPLRMAEVLQRALEEAKYDQEHLSGANDDLTSIPTVEIFNVYLYGLSRQNSNVFVEADTMLKVMTNLHQEQGWHCRPTTKSFALVLAVAQSSHLGDEALSILRSMQATHDVEKALYKEKYGVEYNTRQPELNKHRIVTADTAAYTAAMTAIVKSKRNPERALELLQEMVDCMDGTIVLDPGVFVVALQAYIAMIDVSKVLNIGKNIEIARQAESMLHLMNKAVVNSDKNSPLNDPEGILHVHNTCMNAWASIRYNDSANQAERILRSMLDEGRVRPNFVSFNICLTAWQNIAKLPSSDAANKTQALLNFQMELCDAGLLGKNAIPDESSYARLIQTVANSSNIVDKVSRARALLLQAMDDIKNRRILVSKNPASIFTSVLTACANSPAVSSAMTTNYRATVYSKHASPSKEPLDIFSSAVNTENDDPYSVALKTFQELQNDSFRIGAVPDHHAYYAMLQCVAAHCARVSNDRKTTSERLFAEACQGGQVSRLVMNGIVAALGVEALDHPSMNPSNMPPFWTRNVPPQFRIHDNARGRKSASGREVVANASN